MNVIEKLARAFYEGRNGRGCTPWQDLPESHKAPYRAEAKAELSLVGRAITCSRWGDAPSLAREKTRDKQAELAGQEACEARHSEDDPMRPTGSVH